MLSVVIPLFNEERGVPLLLERVFKVINTIEMEAEVICVDDGSYDHTLDKLLEYRKKEGRLKVLALSRNFGHQAAYSAGLEHAKGEYIAMMDGDLQDPPELFPEMLEKLRTEQWDVVYGHRTGRSEGIIRKWAFHLFHKIFSRLSSFDEGAHAGNFSMMNRTALEALLALKEKQRYLPGLRAFIGFRQTSVSYHREDRQVGEAKMTFGKLFSLAGDALFSFSKVPIKLCLRLGLLGVVVFLMAGIYSLISKGLGWAPLGWSSTILSIYFLGSIQLTFMGVIGEYVYRIYFETQNRPVYFIREVYE